MYGVILESGQDSIDLVARELNLYMSMDDGLDMWDAEGNHYTLPSPRRNEIMFLFDDATETVERLTNFYETPRNSTLSILASEDSLCQLDNVVMSSMTWGVSMDEDDGLVNGLEVTFSFFGGGMDWDQIGPDPKKELQNLDWKKLGF